MSTISDSDSSTFAALDLPREFDGLEGPLRADIEAIVNALTNTAADRLLLSRRQSGLLRATLWNRLADSINDTMRPLSAENR